MAMVLPASFPLGGGGHAAEPFRHAPVPVGAGELRMLEVSVRELAIENERLEAELRECERLRVRRLAPPRPRPPAGKLPVHCFRLTLALGRWRSQFGEGVELRAALCYWVSWGASALARSVATLRQNWHWRRRDKLARAANMRRLLGPRFQGWQAASRKRGAVKRQNLLSLGRFARRILRAWRSDAQGARQERFNAHKATLAIVTRQTRAMVEAWKRYVKEYKAYRELAGKQRLAAARLAKYLRQRRNLRHWQQVAAADAFERKVANHRGLWLARACWDGWTARVRAQRQLRQQLEGAHRHWADGLCTRTLWVLAEVTPLLREHRLRKAEQLEDAIAHDNFRRLTPLFRKWSAWAAQAAAVGEFIFFREQLLMTKVFRILREHAQENVGMRDIEARAARYRTMWLLGRPFTAWVENTEEMRRLRGLLQHATAMMINNQLALVLFRWLSFRERRLLHRSAVHLLGELWTELYLPQYWTVWLGEIRVQRFVRLGALGRAVTAWRAATRAEFCRRYWFWWCGFVAEQTEGRAQAEAEREAKLRQALGRLANRVTSTAWEAWTAHVNTMRGLKRIAAAIANRSLRMVWVTWYERYEAKAALFQRMRAVLSKMQNRALSAAWTTWYDVVDAQIIEKMTQEILEKNLQKWQELGQATVLLQRWLHKRRERIALEKRIEARAKGRARRLDDLQEQAERQRVLTTAAHPQCRLWMYTSAMSRVRVQVHIDPKRCILSVKRMERESTAARSKADKSRRAFAELNQSMLRIEELKDEGGSDEQLRTEEERAERLRLHPEVIPFRDIELDAISHLSWGCDSPNFQALLRHNGGTGSRLHADDVTWRCFSVAYRAAGETHWLDFCATSDESLATCYLGLQSFVGGGQPADSEAAAYTRVTARQLFLRVLHAKVAARTAHALLEPADSYSSGVLSYPAAEASPSDMWQQWQSHVAAAKLSFEEGQAVAPMSVAAWLKTLFAHCNRAQKRPEADDAVDLALFVSQQSATSTALSVAPVPQADALGLCADLRNQLRAPGQHR